MVYRYRSNIRPSRERLLITLAIVLTVPLLAGKPKNKGPKAAPGGAGEPVEPTQAVDLPENLNTASLRVHATDMMYELDLSAEQLKLLRVAATGTASDRKLSAASGDEKLAAAFNNFNRALLARQDDQEIAKLRNQLTELAAADEVHLDDEVYPTSAARAKAPDVCRRFTASQIAAYLAAHADQIADPVEKMLAVVTELPDAGSAEEADKQVHETSEEIGQLVAGSDQKRVRSSPLRWPIGSRPTAI